jgi:hypothetical protein
MQRSKVDLPDPDAPIKTVAVCSGTANERSLLMASNERFQVEENFIKQVEIFTEILF